MIFATLSALIEENLPSEWDSAGVFFYEGPDDPDLPANYVVTLSVDGGLGLQLDGVVDNVSWQVRVSGQQSLQPTAMELAQAIDKVLLSLIPGRHSGELIISTYRVGGPPAHLSTDDAERTQVVCSYYFDVDSGLPPI